jgi:hypothetical protein
MVVVRSAAQLVREPRLTGTDYTDARPGADQSRLGRRRAKSNPVGGEIDLLGFCSATPAADRREIPPRIDLRRPRGGNRRKSPLLHLRPLFCRSSTVDISEQKNAF